VATNTGTSFGCAWADYDNDGNLDLFVAKSPNNSLYHNNGDGTFTEMTSNTVGSIVGDVAPFLYCAWADYDNDGLLDLYVTQASGANFLYHNNGDGAFTRVLTGNPVNDPGNSFTSAWGDYNNDGFLDLFVVRGGVDQPAKNLLYRNNGNSNAWIKIKPVGTISNRSAFGAKVRVLATIRGRRFWQMREISVPSRFATGPLDAHFGLGDATIIDTVRIEWPSGTVQELHRVAVKQFLTVVEPPRLDGVALQADGSVQFNLIGAAGLAFRVET